MSAAPPLTVLMAVHNGLPYLSEALASLAQQTFADFELLIIDDASTDGTADVLRAAAAQDSRLRLLTQTQNLGLTASLNAGLQAARGTWIARHDADDLSHPTRFARQMEEVTRRPDLILLGTNGWMIDDAGLAKGVINAPVGHTGILWSSIFYNPFIHGSVIFHRDHALSQGGYHPDYRIVQDYEFWVRLMKSGPVDNLPDRLISYRLHEGSVTSASSREERKRLLEQITEQALAAHDLSHFISSRAFSLIGRQREGLLTSEVREFWQLHQTMLKSFLSDHDEDRSLREALALLHWRVAGSLRDASLPTQVLELLAAFRPAPAFTARLFTDRWKGAPHVD